jgi:hypothetical protein
MDLSQWGHETAQNTLIGKSQFLFLVAPVLEASPISDWQETRSQRRKWAAETLICCGPAVREK